LRGKWHVESARSTLGSDARWDGCEAQETKQLRDENARLKKLVLELSLDKDNAESGDDKKWMELVDSGWTRTGCE
jgi:hypothetical protein